MHNVDDVGSEGLWKVYENYWLQNKLTIPKFARDKLAQTRKHQTGMRFPVLFSLEVNSFA